MKNIIFVALVVVLILSGCSSKKENPQTLAEVNPPVQGEVEEIESISDVSERDKFQKFIEDFYYNPVVNEETNNSFFENNENITKFSAYYKAEYGSEDSLEKIAETFFGNEARIIEVEGIGNFSGYNNTARSKYLPVVEGIYKNDNLIIVKAGVYSLTEESNSEKKIFGTITATFEINADSEEYYLIDYIYEKVILEEK